MLILEIIINHDNVVVKGGILTYMLSKNYWGKIKYTLCLKITKNVVKSLYFFSDFQFWHVIFIFDYKNIKLIKGK